MTDCLAAPLLLVCKDIRDEASSIYYQDNTFKVHLADFDPSPLTVFGRKAVAMESHGAQFTWSWSHGNPSWDNLLDWLYLYHRGDMERWMPSIDEGCDCLPCIEEKIIDMMFEDAWWLRRYPWQKIEHKLARYRRVLARV